MPNVCSIYRAYNTSCNLRSPQSAVVLTPRLPQSQSASRTSISSTWGHSSTPAMGGGDAECPSSRTPLLGPLPRSPPQHKHAAAAAADAAPADGCAPGAVPPGGGPASQVRGLFAACCVLRAAAWGWLGTCSCCCSCCMRVWVHTHQPHQATALTARHARLQPPPHSPSGSSYQNSLKPLTLWPLVVLIFFEVSGGPFGTEVRGRACMRAHLGLHVSAHVATFAIIPARAGCRVCWRPAAHHPWLHRAAAGLELAGGAHHR